MLGQALAAARHYNTLAPCVRESALLACPPIPQGHVTSFPPGAVFFPSLLMKVSAVTQGAAFHPRC